MVSPHWTALFEGSGTLAAVQSLLKSESPDMKRNFLILLGMGSHILADDYEKQYEPASSQRYHDDF
jgi:hypothetical protein